jgi:nuclear transcription factor Y, gamma
MKSDEDVKMISAEAPILFAKGCDIFITELTMRAWIHAEESKRRTLQRSDIAQAISKSDMFDFLIDIVPREVAQQHASMGGSVGGAPSFDYKRGGDEAGPPGASPGGNAPGAFPLGGYQDHAQGGVNYQSGPLGYAATPPGSSAGQGGQAYPHHSAHPLYDGNRYDPMYYSGQQVPSIQECY